MSPSEVARNAPSVWIVGRLCLVATILLIVALASGGLVAQTPSSTPLRRVLVLYSDERLLPANIILDEAMRTTFAPIATRIEFLAIPRRVPISRQAAATARFAR
jgi:hypothetical protein